MKIHEQMPKPVCLVRGHRFLQEGREWVDEAVQFMPTQARRIRVRFDTPEFFKLLVKQPDLLPNRISARNVQLALGDTISENYE